jgi:hypothetical protein
MTEKFDSTFINSGLYGGVNGSDEDFDRILNINTPVSKSAPDSNDHFNFKLDISDLLDSKNQTMNSSTNKNGFWKYEEDKTLKEIEQYLTSTYHSHYTSDNSKTQTLDLIESIGDAEPFVRSNAIKYLSRFGKKNGKSKLDILKAIHYCILLYHFAGLHKGNKDSYETF